jgi:signal peptidase II
LALTVLGVTAAALAATDLLTKELVLSRLEGSPPVRLLGGAVYLDLTRNPGAAFSIGVDYTFVFPIIGVVVLGVIAVLVWRLRSLLWALSMGMIVGGVIGNLVDRLFRAPGPMHGHVVDFISVFAEGGRVFPIFNVADSALFCGVLIAILLELTGRRRDGGREPSRRPRSHSDDSSGHSGADSGDGVGGGGPRRGVVPHSDQ